VSNVDPMPSTPRSGRQITIAANGYSATIASIGASLRSLTFEGRDLVVPFEEDEVRPGYRGATLAPWPNRVVDGTYAFAGIPQQLALTEPERGHALHGLLAWVDFDVVATASDRVTLEVAIPAQDGYPFRVVVQTEYAVGPDGLTQTVTGTNVDTDAAPWGAGPHPYLWAGDGAVDAWTLTLPADEVLLVTEDRLSPVRVESVEVAPEFDFREPRVIGDTFIDHAFTSIGRDASGIATVTVRAEDGRGVELTWDERCPWVQIHTADTPEVPLTHRIGLAVEPMTCPPDAFNSGVDLVVLEPGQSHTAGWRIAAI
jgi:aldose 1-epimerase